MREQDYKDTNEAALKVYQQYQMGVHKDDIEDVTPKKYKRFLIDSPLIVSVTAVRNSN